MNDRTPLLKIVRAADPWPAEREIPSVVVDDLALAASAPEVGTVPPSYAADEHSPPGIRRGVSIALATAVALATIVVGSSVLLGGSDSPAVTASTVPPTTTVTTTLPTTSTLVRPTFDVEALAVLAEPRTQDDVNEVFLALPAELLGMTATRDDPEHVGFVDYTGDSDFAHIAWIEAGPNSEAVASFLEDIRSLPEFVETSSSPRWDVPFVWLEGMSQYDDRLLLWWGNPEDGWIFSLEASSLETQAALIEAFISASSRDANDDTTGSDTQRDISQLALDEPWSDAWIGEEFTAAPNLEERNGRLELSDEWVAHPDALGNVGNWTIQILVANEPSGLWPWDSGGAAAGRPRDLVLVVGTEPNPYAIGEYEVEVLGRDPAPSDTSETHELALWAVRETSTGTYEVTDVMPITRTGENMGYGALVTLWQEFDLCRVDARISGSVFAWFDVIDPEIETFYPATTAFQMTDVGSIEMVETSIVECIVNVDWQTRGY